MKEKRKDALKSVGKLGQSTFIDLASKYGSEYLKEIATSLIGEVAIDTGASLIPGVSETIQTYKRKRLERNMSRAAEETLDRINEVESKLYSKSKEQRKQIDELFGMILDFVSDEPQEEKIKYFINGFVNLADHEAITEDFVLTYYDLMSNLRMIDLAVLRMYSQLQFIDQTQSTLKDIMEEYGLSYEQYNSVRYNLQRQGLLTTLQDKESINDLDSLFESIKTINKYLTKLEKGKAKNLPKLKDPKMKSKERFRLSKFGRQFTDFFLEDVENKG